MIVRFIYVIFVVIYVYLLDRNWELDVDIGLVNGVCKDIVQQFIDNNYDIQVVKWDN